MSTSCGASSALSTISTNVPDDSPTLWSNSPCQNDSEGGVDMALCASSPWTNLSSSPATHSSLASNQGLRIVGSKVFGTPGTPSNSRRGAEELRGAEGGTGIGDAFTIGLST